MLILTQQEAPPVKVKKPVAAKKPAAKASAGAGEAQVVSYRHSDKRKNNPQVGLVNEETDPGQPKTTWRYDPHIDPALSFDPSRAHIETLIDDALASGDEAAMRTALEELKRRQSPYLNWTGKAERTSFAVDTVSLHVHERIDAMSILATVRKRMNDAKAEKVNPAVQPGLFDAPFENLPLRDAIDFYKHERGWANRLVAGDSLLVMNSLLQKESMAGQVQMIYLDPPYGIKYGSNFQPFVGKRDVKDRKDEDLTQEPEMIKAFRDTWELGIHSYLTYLRDRLLLAKDLLSESGSVFVQISDENVHLVRNLMDEIFGVGSYISTICYRTRNMTLGGDSLAKINDYILWYSKDPKKYKFRPLFQSMDTEGDGHWNRYLRSDGSRHSMDADQVYDHSLIPQDTKTYQLFPLYPVGYSADRDFIFEFCEKAYKPPKGRSWKSNLEGMQRLAYASRLEPYQSGDTLRYVIFVEDYPVSPLHNFWADTAPQSDKDYVVQTATSVIERCLLMATDPGDLVLDPTCGSGTTAFVAEKWGRRWITCDTSRVAVTLAKQRLMTASYDYYELRYPHEGLRGGFIWKTVPHVTLKSIANNPEIDEIYARMHPAIETALGEVNAALAEIPPSPPFAKGGAESGGTNKFPPLKKGGEGGFAEWEIPFDFPVDWPQDSNGPARKSFDAFHAARQSMQKQMDASIAAHAGSETLYDQPAIAKNKLRISGPFTVEAVPFPSVLSLEEAEQPVDADVAIARSGESARQHNWRDELLKTGIRGKGGQMLKFAELETLPGTVCLHASGTLITGERVVVSFGPEHAALEQRQVEHALREAGELFPLPTMIVFCAFAFDPEAAKDIDCMKGITALKAQMNTDLLTEDLKKARSSNQSFWLMGQPDVELRKIPPSPPLTKGGAPSDNPTLKKGGGAAGGIWYEVEVNGFDYFDTAKGELVSGGKSKIAMWSLDTDYDDRSLFPRQVFFPMAGKDEGWRKLKKNIRAELNEGLLDQFHSTVSLPFEAGENRKVAVKIVDDRGIESLKVISLGDAK